MIHQYGSQRFRIVNGRRIGTVPIGTIVYLQDRYYRYASPICRNPWIVDAWCGERSKRHCAIVRSLRDGRIKTVSDCHLLAAVDADLVKGGAV